MGQAIYAGMQTLGTVQARPYDFEILPECKNVYECAVCLHDNGKAWLDCKIYGCNIAIYMDFSQTVLS